MNSFFHSFSQSVSQSSDSQSINVQINILSKSFSLSKFSQVTKMGCHKKIRTCQLLLVVLYRQPDNLFLFRSKSTSLFQKVKSLNCDIYPIDVPQDTCDTKRYIDFDVNVC